MFADVYEPAVTAVLAKAMVTAEEPLKLVPDSPVPMVSALVVVPPPPPVPDALIVMLPEVFVMVTLVPAVSVASEKPDPVPISNWPLLGVAVCPVPP